MARERPQAPATRILRRPSAVTVEDGVRWTVRVANAGPRTIHVSTSIQQISPSADGRRLVVSTVRPEPDPSISFAVFALPTTPVNPGEEFDQDFALELPIRLVHFEGLPLRAVTTEWLPAPSFELVTELAFGDRPFQLPRDPARRAAALARWTQTTQAPRMRLRAAARSKE